MAYLKIEPNIILLYYFFTASVNLKNLIMIAPGNSQTVKHWYYQEWFHHESSVRVFLHSTCMSRQAPLTLSINPQILLSQNFTKRWTANIIGRTQRKFNFTTTGA